MKTKINQFTPKVKWGNKFIDIDGGYYCDNFYDKKIIPLVRKEIEDEFPRYRGKVVFFQHSLEKTDY